MYDLATKLADEIRAAHLACDERITQAVNAFTDATFARIQDLHGEPKAKPEQVAQSVGMEAIVDMLGKVDGRYTAEDAKAADALMLAFSDKPKLSVVDN